MNKITPNAFEITYIALTSAAYAAEFVFLPSWVAQISNMKLSVICKTHLRRKT